MTEPVNLSIVRAERQMAQTKRHAREMRSDLFKAARGMLRQAGDDIAGYALIVWDKDGDTGSKYKRIGGPIGRRAIPLHAANVLNQHVAADMADDE